MGTEALHFSQALEELMLLVHRLPLELPGLFVTVLSPTPGLLKEVSLFDLPL